MWTHFQKKIGAVSPEFSGWCHFYLGGRGGGGLAAGWRDLLWVWVLGLLKNSPDARCFYVLRVHAFVYACVCMHVHVHMHAYTELWACGGGEVHYLHRFKFDMGKTILTGGLLDKGLGPMDTVA